MAEVTEPQMVTPGIEQPDMQWQLDAETVAAVDQLATVMDGEETYRLRPVAQAAVRLTMSPAESAVWLFARDANSEQLLSETYLGPQREAFEFQERMNAVQPGLGDNTVPIIHWLRGMHVVENLRAIHQADLGLREGDDRFWLAYRYYGAGRTGSNYLLSRLVGFESSQHRAPLARPVVAGRDGAEQVLPSQYRTTAYRQISD